MVEGSMAPIEALQGWKWGEVVKFTTESFGAAYSTAFFVVMNKDKWAALPADLQKMIEQVSHEWVRKTGTLWDEIDKAGRDFTLKRGNKIIPLTKKENDRWKRAAAPILDQYIKNMKEKGLPGKEALNFCLKFLQENS